jgi:septal ring factor EnvC (AmiA/AmiB activator)
MDKPTRTPSDELALGSAGDPTPIDNPDAFHVQWKNALARKIFDALPHPVYLGNPDHYNRNALTGELVRVVVEIVGQADAILAEAVERLTSTRGELGRRTELLAARDEQIEQLRASNAELNEALDHACKLAADLERDCDRVKTAAIVQRIELERARDQLQDLEIKLAGAQARITAAEDAERKLRGGN